MTRTTMTWMLSSIACSRQIKTPIAPSFGCAELNRVQAIVGEDIAATLVFVAQSRLAIAVSAAACIPGPCARRFCASEQRAIPIGATCLKAGSVMASQQASLPRSAGAGHFRSPGLVSAWRLALQWLAAARPAL